MKSYNIYRWSSFLITGSIFTGIITVGISYVAITKNWEFTDMLWMIGFFAIPTVWGLYAGLVQKNKVLGTIDETGVTVKGRHVPWEQIDDIYIHRIEQLWVPIQNTLLVEVRDGKNLQILWVGLNGEKLAEIVADVQRK